MRMDKPIGVLLLFLPCAFGVGLNSYEFIDFYLILKFFLGALLLRPAGCIINDIWDKDFDVKVDRTKSRPLASGKVIISESLVLLLGLLFAGFILLLSFHENTIYFTLITIPLIIFYPAMKRITFFPQAFLGVTFNFGVLIACFEINGELNLASIILYLGCVFWTLGYDTIYGFMDAEDDKKIGVKSVSLLIENSKPHSWIMLFYFIFLFAILYSCILGGKFNDEYDFIISFCIILHLFWQVITLDIKNRENCLNRFKSNSSLGILVFLIMIT